MLSPQSLDWLKLVLVPGIGARRVRRLLEKFYTPAAILAASYAQLIEVEEISPDIARNIVEGKQKFDLKLQLDLIGKHKIRLITLDSDDYPENLRAIYDPAPVLFVKGNFQPDDYFSVAMVGTRLSSAYGALMARKLSLELVERGFTIVSGGARGIDTVSHKSALAGGGRTVAVLGCGLDVRYPPENAGLFEEIAQAGAVISEFPMTTPPERQNFPMRNRIISGLSLGVLVVEAPHRSGALITVTAALEQGREVFSIPGRADTFTSKGSNSILKDGAKLVECADDIVEELKPLLKDRLRSVPEVSSSEPEQFNPACGLSVEEARLYLLLNPSSFHLDDLVRQSGFSPQQALGVLTGLEIRGLVRRSAGMVFGLK